MFLRNRQRTPGMCCRIQRYHLAVFAQPLEMIKEHQVQALSSPEALTVTA